MTSEKHLVKLLPSDKENGKKSSKLSYSKSWASTRNPLSTLSDNVPLQNSLKKSEPLQEPTKACPKKTVIKKSVHPRTSSTSEIEKKVKFRSPPAKGITLRNRAELENAGDEVFVDGDKHYLGYLPDKAKNDNFHKNTQYQEQKTEIVQTLPVVRSSAGTELAKKPSRKVTLVRKLSNRYCRYKVENFYSDCLYNEEYFESNYRYMLMSELDFVFRKSFITRNSNFSYRLVIVNWLNYLHEILELSETTLFVTVRMFDNLLAKKQISTDNYGLVAIVCVWIANKLCDSRHILVSKLFALGNGKYSKNQILSMEKEILTLFDFKLNYPEPVTFLYYYLKKENIETDSKIRFSAMFFLETATFLLEFSSSPPSLLASAALYLVLLKFDFPCDNFLSYIKSHLIDEHVFKKFANDMLYCMKEIWNCKCFNNEVIAKYSVQDKCNVAQFFISD